MSRPARYPCRHSGNRIAYSVGGSHVAGAARLEYAHKVGTAVSCFQFSVLSGTPVVSGTPEISGRWSVG